MKTVIVNRIPSRLKILNCVNNSGVQLTLAVFWTELASFPRSFTCTHCSGNYGSHYWIMDIVQRAWEQSHKSRTQLKAWETTGTRSGIYSLLSVTFLYTHQQPEYLPLWINPSKATHFHSFYCDFSHRVHS